MMSGFFWTSAAHFTASGAEHSTGALLTALAGDAFAGHQRRRFKQQPQLGRDVAVHSAIALPLVADSRGCFQDLKEIPVFF
jgi:hypothetical protein